MFRCLWMENGGWEMGDGLEGGGGVGVKGGK